MEQTRRRVEFVVRMNEAQPREEPPRRNIAGIMPGEDRLDPGECESILEKPRRGFEGITLPPVARRDVNAEFGSVGLARARSQAAATDVLPGGKKEDRPILDAISRCSRSRTSRGW
jgi:hypothetical protein